MNISESRKKSFTDTFSCEPTHGFQAPGRVNIIGEHTDYNDGFCLPAAINFQTVVLARKADDNIVRVLALDYNNEVDEFNLDEPIESLADKGWANYVRGVVVELLNRGCKLKGAYLAISGNVPQGAGLSSSASLEVATAGMFDSLFQLQLSKSDLATIGQAAENNFVGCKCGIMDQLISAKGIENSAQLLDCRSLECTTVKIPDELSIVIINSNVKRELVGSEYNDRREACETAAKTLGVKALRDIDEQTLEQNAKKLSDMVYRRARHIVTENKRVLDARIAFANHDIAKTSELMAGSHKSMALDFEITIPEIDTLVDIIHSVIGKEGGVRMTGGGFGGCVVALVKHDQVDKVVEIVNQQYPEKTGIKPTVYVCKASAGAGEFTI